MYKWKKAAKEQGLMGPGESSTERWSTREKFAIVVETATLTEVELSEYCLSKGLYVEQVEAWRDACMQANGGITEQASKLQKDLRVKDQEIKELSREFQRKEAALAETAALLVLRKKARAIESIDLYSLSVLDLISKQQHRPSDKTFPVTQKIRQCITNPSTIHQEKTLVFSKSDLVSLGSSIPNNMHRTITKPSPKYKLTK